VTQAEAQEVFQAMQQCITRAKAEGRICEDVTMEEVWKEVVRQQREDHWKEKEEEYEELESQMEKIKGHISNCPICLSMRRCK
jgi:uncharacterized Fe-S radical SAM superfamily protein PflX